MDIILGKTAGFCYGVKRAVEEAEKEAKNTQDIYCLGELVHNKNIIKRLEEKGINFIEEIKEKTIEQAKDKKSKIIIRAHGETKETYEKLKQQGIEIIDLTCPNVLKTHKIAEEYRQDGYFIIVIGIKNHAEAVATLSFCGDDSFLVQEEEDIENCTKKIQETSFNKILIMAQTTYNSKKFDYMVELLKSKLNNKTIVIKKTICGATEERQKEAIEIAKKVDTMIIVGDKKSSNTNKLYDIASEICKRAIFVQDAEELNLEDLCDTKKVGIMAGASTPKEDIEEVVNKIRSEELCCI